MRTARTLLEIQRRFLAALYDDAEPGPVAAIAGHGLEPAARLRIYRHSCHEIQAGALRTTYPAVFALVGEAFFNQAARTYRVAYPSHSGNLQAFGRRFADHLAGLPAVQALPYLPAVARLEWLRQESALAAEPEAAPALESATPRVDPSLRVLASPYPILTIWRYAMQPTPERLRLPDAGERIALWREGAQVAMAPLDAASFACIEALARGGALDAAYAAGRRQDRDFNFAACIESLVERGLLRMRAAPDLHEESLP